MTRIILESKPFQRVLQRVLKKEPQLADDLRTTLRLLAEDAFQPQLKTHKLKGKLAGAWACSAGYDLRIIFELVEVEGKPASYCQRLVRMTKHIEELIIDSQVGYTTPVGRLPSQKN